VITPMSTQAPTYREFRDFALSHGYTGRTLAPHVEADEPVKTATRILVFLTGTSWDNEPLPYPKLCALYHGAGVPQQRETPAPYPHVTVANLPHVNPEHRSWLALWESGWSVQKIADAWSSDQKPLTADHVQAALDEVSLAPYSAPSTQALFQRKVDRAAEITVEAFQRVAKERGWSEDWIVAQCGDEIDHPAKIVHEIMAGKARTRAGFHFNPSSSEWHDLSQTVIPWAPLIRLYQRARGQTPARSDEKLCACSCGRAVAGGRKWASPGCRKRVQRRKLQTV
jgi:hypothetical protein